MGKAAGTRDDGLYHNEEELLTRASTIIKEVAAEFELPLEDSKEESLILRPRGQRKRGIEKKWDKWLGIILDEDLECDVHWKKRIDKARKMLGALNGIGTSQWGISTNSWTSAYTGMIRTIATWGAELGWRGQHDWKEAMAKLQYQALRWCTGAVLGSRRDKVDKIAAVESVGKFMSAAQARFLSRSMADPGGVGDL